MGAPDCRRHRGDRAEGLMTLLVVPDVLKSMSSYLASVPEITAIVSTAAGWTNGGSGNRISGALGKNWKVPTQGIVIRRAGGPGADDIGLHRSRLDVWCYGSNGREAVNLWRIVHAALCPQQPIIRGWTFDNCKVLDVDQDADPIPADDTDTDWAILITPYMLLWRETPA
jgi:hypothetical protein